MMNEQTLEALEYCKAHRDELRAGMYHDDVKAVHLWGAYVGANHSRTMAAYNWLVEKYREYREPNHA